MRLLLTLITILSLNRLQSQIIATTDDGQKVILNKNGTWKYVQSNKAKPIVKTKDTTQVIPNITLQPMNTSSDDMPPPPENSISGDCSKYLKAETDKFTGKQSIAGKSFIVIPSKTSSNEGLRILNVLVGEKKVIVCSITAVGSITCVDKGDKVSFLCTDGTKFTLSNSSDFNCKGTFTIYLGDIFGNEQEKGYLSNKKVSAIRVETSRANQDVELSNEQSERLMMEIKCLTKY